MTPDGNFTISLGPGASEGRVDFTALVEWPTNLIPFTPCELQAAGAGLCLYRALCSRSWTA